MRIEKFMQSRGKELKPEKEKVKKSQLNTAKRNELIDDLLEKLGYLDAEKK